MELTELRDLITKMKKGGVTYEQSQTVIEPLIKSNGNVALPDALNELEVIYSQQPDGSGLYGRLREWLYAQSVSNRQIDVRECQEELEIVSNRQKSTCREFFYEQCKKGTLRKIRYNVYEIVDDNAPEIDIENVDLNNTVDIKLPFGLHRWQIIYPKNLIIIVGDTDSGKSAFCLQVLKLNNNGKLPIEKKKGGGSSSSVWKSRSIFSCKNSGDVRNGNFLKLSQLPRLPRDRSRSFMLGDELKRDCFDYEAWV